MEWPHCRPWNGHIGHGSKCEKQGCQVCSEVTAGELASVVSEAGDLVGDGHWLLAAALLDGSIDVSDEIIWILAGVVFAPIGISALRSYLCGLVTSEIGVGLSPGRFGGVLHCFGLLVVVLVDDDLHLLELTPDGLEVWIQLLHLLLVEAL